MKGGVPGDQQSPRNAPAIREVGDPPADDVGAVGYGISFAEHRGDKRGILGLLVGFVGVDHELEAADAVRDEIDT